MCYRVFDNKTSKDITDEFQWVITPDGGLRYIDYGDVIEDKSVHFVSRIDLTNHLNIKISL